MLPKNPQNSRQALHEIFFNSQNKCAEVGTLIPYFKMNKSLFYLSFFSKEFLNPQVKINKIIKKYSVDYRPFLAGLTSRIHSLIFLQSFSDFISPEYLLNFVLNLYVPPWLGNIFNFMVSRLQILSPNRNRGRGGRKLRKTSERCHCCRSGIFIIINFELISNIR